LRQIGGRDDTGASATAVRSEAEDEARSAEQSLPLRHQAWSSPIPPYLIDFASLFANSIVAIQGFAKQ
jgi:hypothetical protein